MEEDQVLRSMVRDDAYKVVRVLAEGPAGKTELVTLGGDELLVRKRIPMALANASAWATLMGMRSPRLPRIEEIYQMPDELVVVYSYVQGRSVAEIVGQEGRQSPAVATRLLVQTCAAAAALHAAGLVHRDITPGNVIVADDGAHLVDLGIARRQRPDGSRDTSVLGTWGFAAPEQFGFAQTDQRSDVYALGRLLGYLLTGVRPDDESYERVLADEAVVPRWLAQVVAKATAFEPSARYQSAYEMQKALDGPQDAGAGAVAADATPLPKVALGSKLPRDIQRASAWKTAPEQARSRSDATALEWVGAIIVWGTAVFLAVVDVMATYDAVFTGDPPWTPAQYGMSVVMLCGLAAISYEVYQAVTRKGSYGSAPRPAARALVEACKIVVITFLLFFLCALVLPRGST